MKQHLFSISIFVLKKKQNTFSKGSCFNTHSAWNFGKVCNDLIKGKTKTWVWGFILVMKKGILHLQRQQTSNFFLFASFQPVGFVTFQTRAGAEAAKQDLQVNYDDLNTFKMNLNKVC